MLNILLLFFISFINAQIALPTFHGVHKPQSTSSSSLYDFTTQTFTNCGETGRYGPTLSDCTGDPGINTNGSVNQSNGGTDGSGGAGSGYSYQAGAGGGWLSDGGGGHSRCSYPVSGGSGIYNNGGAGGEGGNAQGGGTNYYGGFGGGGGASEEPPGSLWGPPPPAPQTNFKLLIYNTVKIVVLYIYIYIYISLQK